jgi:hypothetical protein
MMGVAKGKYERLPQFAHNKTNHTLEEISGRVFQVAWEQRESTGYNGDWAFRSRWYRGKRSDSHVDKAKWDIYSTMER